ncbi:MAG: hypothetical protein IJ619_09130 [Eubacterium sp.]|nr:hypothetical protein [Eubacterium sp.]
MIYVDVELPPFKKSNDDTVNRLNAYVEAVNPNKDSRPSDNAVQSEE